MEIIKKKKKRVKINKLIDLKNELGAEGVFLEEFTVEALLAANIDKVVINRILEVLKSEEVTYVSTSVEGFIEYIKREIELEEYIEKLYKKLSNIESIKIHRVEYEREPAIKDNVDEVVELIKVSKENTVNTINEEELNNLANVEKSIDEEYLYAKDIELLKKILLSGNSNFHEEYNDENKIRVLTIKVPKGINLDYIKVRRGSIEYYEHISSYIPRLKRLSKNLHKYLHKESSIINHSSAIQDSVNIAIANYNGRDYKAISGKNNIKGFCKAPLIEEGHFEACKVNKLGKLGVGYRRVNDSEKKILEEISREIQNGKVPKEGILTLYSKWEPCPSCYYVISQFCEKYPDIKVKIKYSREYGER